MSKLGLIRDDGLKSLIKIGTQGFFPLFDQTWFDSVLLKKELKLTKNEKVLAKKIIQRIQQYKCLERKKTVILTLIEEEREIFIKAFLYLVEGQILDDRPQLQ